MALYRSPEYQTSFVSIGLLVQEEQFKIHFQDDSCEGHLGFLIGMILTIFDLQVTLKPPTPSRSAFWSKNRSKIDLQDGSNLEFWSKPF